MDGASLKEMQLEELEALQAIYMDDYVDLTEGSGPSLIILKLIPLQSIVGKDVYAKVDMKVQYTTQYPLDSPVLHLENEKGISKEQISKLKKELDDMASDLCGEVMVLQLAHHVQSYLHQFNVPSLSFFDQMLANQQKHEEMLLLEKEKERKAKVAEDREHDQDVIRQVKEELVKREEAIKQERRKRNESLTLSSSPLTSSGMMVNLATLESSGRESFSCPLSKEGKFSVSVFRGKSEDRKLFCSSCVGHYFDGACSLTAIDELSGNVMSIAEWKPQIQKKKANFSVNNGKRDSDIYKQIQGIEQEFNYLKMKITHNGLANYHSLEIDHSSQYISIKVLMDHIHGVPLSSYLCKEGLSIILIQSICKQVVDILSFLHSKSVAHKDFCLSNTFMHGNDVILNGYGVIPRITEMCKLINITQENIPMPKDNFGGVKDLIKTGKKGDIFNLGLVLLSLYQGHTNITIPVIIPEDVPQLLKDFLICCLEVDETKRSSATQLSKHSFLMEKLYNKQVESHDKGNIDLESDSSYHQYNEKDVHLPIFPDHLVLGRSRLINEFEVIEFIGKGGFGSVIKVKNKLDGNTYAIKRIQLKPKSMHLNRRMTREVKLLSRLNHENVVRYFNSWIEAEDITWQEGMSIETESDQLSKNINKSEKTSKVELEFKRNLEDSLLKINDVDFTGCPEIEGGMDTSWDETLSKRCESSSSSSSSSEERACENIPKSISTNMRSRSNRADSSEGIVFQIEDSMMQFGDQLDSDYSDEDGAENVNQTEETEESSDNGFHSQYLYIQMECCERSTLRIAIDNGLYKKANLVWKHFREIVEGMAHVHAQGIIHRDLKPINIFMDSNGKIKIGDFGLATSLTIKQGASTFSQTDSVQSNDGTVSGKVGTALYVAPELCDGRTRVKVSPKADMYSLGIILFEMFHRPLDTKMERVKILGLLRTVNIVFPDDFPIKKFVQDHAKDVCRSLLDHDPDKRPTAKELLESGYIPPKMEDHQLDELLKHTLSQNNSTRYQRLMSALFNRPVSPVADQLYDKDDQGKSEASILYIARILQYVRNVVTKIFTRHDAIFIEVPLLMPKNKILDNAIGVATFIDQSGLQLSLPFDSRICFARYISKNNINNVKRYYFGKLYREQTIMGAHPTSFWECSYDIVSDSSNSLLLEAEILYTVNEIIKEFPKLHSRYFYIRLTHTNFIKAVFLQSKFDEETQMTVLKILETSKNLKQLETSLNQYFLQLNYSEHLINKLLLCLTFEGSITKACETLLVLRKSKPNVSNLIKQAFFEINELSRHLNDLSCDFTMEVCTYLSPKMTHYNGIFFQVVTENKRKRKHGGVDILAQGGCYSQLIVSMSKYAETSILPSAVGVSIDVEKVLFSVLETNEGEMTLPLSKLDVVVCSVTDKSLQILNGLWNAGINANFFSYGLNEDFNLEEIQEYCKTNSIRHMITLKETDNEFIRLRSLERDSKREERFADIGNLCTFLLSKLKPPSKQEKEVDMLAKPVNNPHLSGNFSCEFKHIFLEKVDIKDSKEKRRREKVENAFMSTFRKELQKYFGSNEQLQVIVTCLGRNEVKTIAGFLEITGSYEEFESSVQDIIEKHGNQGRIKKTCQTIFDVYTDYQAQSTVLLYSYVDDLYKVIGISKSCV